MKQLVLFYSLLGFISLQAQPSLSLDQAIELAITHNVSIKIARQQRDIESLKSEVKQANLLPKLSATIGLNAGQADVRQKLSDNRIIERNGANSLSQNASVLIQYTLFNGFKAYAISKQVDLETTHADMVLLQQINTVVSQTVSAYASLRAAQKSIEALNQLDQMYLTRLELVRAKFQAGLTDKTAVLQSQIDRNQIQARLILARNELSPLAEALNNLLGRNKNEVVQTLAYELKSFDSIPETLAQGNLELRSREILQQIAQEQIRVSKSEAMPRLDFNGAYNFTQSQNQAGFLLLNQNRGLNLGLSLNIPLFAGFSARKNLRISKVLDAQIKLSNELLSLELRQELSAALGNWRSQKEILKLEKQNEALALENLEIMQEKFRQNLISLLELKNAEEYYELSRIRNIEFEAKCKLAETKVAELGGQLVNVSMVSDSE